MSNFRTWTRQRLNKRFGLKQVQNHPFLQSLIATPIELNDFERESAEYLRKILAERVDFWNEEELKIKFIGGIISLVNFETDYFSAFADRYLGAIVDGEELSGLPDIMVAGGTQEPEMPYFCLHEYKKEIDNSSPDPAGQCLAAMLAAQALNNDAFPIYGTYVIGRNWFFLVLTGQEYSISNSYSATHDDEILDIIRILKASKEIVMQEVLRAIK